MTGPGQIKAALRRAARDGPARDRASAFDRPEDGAAIILGHVDATVLPRRLVFDLDSGGRLACLAASRRLIRLLPPLPPGLGDAFEGNLPADAAATGRALADLCREARRVTLSEDVATAEEEVTGTGLAPAAIAATLDRTLDRRAPDADPLDALAAALAPDLTCAFTLLEEEVEVLCGDGAAVTALSDFAGDLLGRLLDPGFPLAATLETDGLVIVALGGDADSHVAVAGHLGRYLVAVLDRGDPTPTLAAWRALRLGVGGSQNDKNPSD